MNPYGITQRDGHKVDWITEAALLLAGDRLGYDLTVTQGSYNAGGVKASAGTHDGGGVVDLRPFDAVNKVRVLRQVGFAAWLRAASKDWPEHIHAVQIGNDKLSPAAQRQVKAYFDGRNGLANGGPDDGPRLYVDRYRAGGFRFDRVAQARILLHQARAARPPSPALDAAINKLRSVL